jgi:hypothetical protein
MAQASIDLDQLLFDDEPLPASVSRFPLLHPSPTKRAEDVYAQQLQSAYDELRKRHAMYVLDDGLSTLRALIYLPECRAESTIEHLKLHQGHSHTNTALSSLPVAFDAESESAHVAARRAELERTRALGEVAWLLRAAALRTMMLASSCLRLVFERLFQNGTG